jgi:hypothetical protein
VNDERFVNETKARLRSLMARTFAGEGESRESSLRGDMLADGYFKVRTFSKEITHARPIGSHTTRQLQMPGVEWLFRVSLLAEAVATLVRFGWHPVWVIMYDEVAATTTTTIVIVITATTKLIELTPAMFDVGRVSRRG